MSNDIDQPPELDWLDSAIITRLEPQVREWIAEAGQYFPDPPTVHTIHWFGGRSSLITKSSGVGGFSYAPGEISLAWNEDYQSDKDKQIEFFKDTVFHEFYHQVQGYVGVGGQLGDLSPLQVAVYEGAASVFARDKTGIADTFVDYSDLTQDNIDAITQELSSMSASDKWDWDKWKFKHPKYGRHVLYKLGTFFVDQYLQQHPELKIEDLARFPVDKVISQQL